MAWKKLAFTDEMLTNPMTANLDMAGYQVNGLMLLSGQNSDSWVELHGGSSVYDAEIMIFGKDTTGLEGDITFRVPNAAKNNQLTAMTVNGASDTPIVDINYGLDMKSQKIDNIGDVQADAAAGIVIREYGGNDIGAMAVSGNNDYTMRLKNTDGNTAVDLAGTTYAMIAHYPINMDQKEIDAMVFENLATAPHAASEVQGEVYYDTVDDHLHVWVV